ncbi:unnamed protein product [Candidula unifasciata]|uniref:Large ribosomal subunit protein uL18m n=1 Tax=Candidula unifasciata TaxID=100452 RepID=A0A8S3YER5_9EUPU|nr:unnamed protein product [Candidula unifasciata]
MQRLQLLSVCRNKVQLSQLSRHIFGFCRQLSTSNRHFTDSQNKDYVVSRVFHNRNPRNLEKLALAKKRTGWTYQAPRRDYYHKLVICHTNRHTEAYVQHFSGEKVLSASTNEWAVRNQLYSCTDVSASIAIGKVLALRCLQSGITSLFYDDAEKPSEKTSCVLQAFKEANIALTEPTVIEAEYRPGINYDGYNRYAEPKEWKEDYQDV